MLGFFQGGAHDEDNNVLFGDGGAGAFSDAKLTARRRDAATDFVFEMLIDHGAPEKIGYEHRPHLGTDGITGIVENIKQDVIRLGGRWINGAKAIGFGKKNGALTQVHYQKDGQRMTMPADCAVLAIGHSARDTYTMLHQSGIAMAFKPFAVGLRIEHPQQWLNHVQYGAYADHPKLGAADYALTAKHNTRGVYTFCMCPGGMVIPSVSEKGHLCVNGMSYAQRNGQNANAAIVIQVLQGDCGAGPLAGIAFQRRYEKQAFALSQNYAAPVQRLGDFIRDQRSSPPKRIMPSYPRGTVLINLRDCLAPFVYDGILHGIAQFDKKLKGFAMEDAVLTGVETRTSAPVRILRRDDMQCERLRGLYPAGEGAGYAGGIVSAAADGVKCAQRIAAQYAPLL